MLRSMYIDDNMLDCPFCGSGFDKIDIKYTHTSNDILIQYKCTCGLVTPEFKSYDRLKQFWGFRYIPLDIEAVFQEVSPIIASKWFANEEDKTEIEGEWAEDNHPYTISCPHQLRNAVLSMQNTYKDLMKLLGYEGKPLT